MGAQWRLLSASFLVVCWMGLADAQIGIDEPCTIQRDGSSGVCKLINDCPSAAAQIANRQRPTICGFAGRISIVCCERQRPRRPVNNNNNNNFNSNNNGFNSNNNGFNSNDNGFNSNNNGFNNNEGNNGGDSDASRFSNLPSNNNGFNNNGFSNNNGFNNNRGNGDSNSRRPQKRVSVRMCEEFSSQVTEELQALPLLPDPEPITFQVAKCSLPKTPLIVGGEEARPGEFPHMVAVGFASGSTVLWSCGGTLISNKFVITACHCTFNRQTNGPPTVVRLGAHNLAYQDDPKWVDVPVSRVILHPSYTAPSKYNDIALLELQNAVTFTEFIRPACLWQDSTISQAKAIATGWGKIGYTEDTSDVLMKVQLDLIDPVRCNGRISNMKSLKNGIVASQLCAGDLSGGRNDTCQGDSGGPLVVSSTTNRCVFNLLAVTSFGFGCGSGLPAVYSRISSFIPWIESEVWPNQ